MIKMMLLFTRRTFVLSVGGFTNLSHGFLVQVRYLKIYLRFYNLTPLYNNRSFASAPTSFCY